MKKMLRTFSVALCACFAAGGAAGCGEDKPSGGEGVAFETVWSEGNSHAFSEGSEFTLNLNASVGEKNYLKLEFETSCSLDATMYFAEENGSRSYSERFFLHKGDTEFRQILDYYHENKFPKKLSYITFKSVGGTSGEFHLKEVSAAVHPIDFSKVNFYDSKLEEEMQLYIEGNEVKLGVTLKSGGAVNYLSSINQGVRLSMDGDNVYVGQDNRGMTVREDDVNLVNAYDTGRLIQQSFYGTLGDSLAEPKDDYECGTFDHDGDPSTPEEPWPYNPVQGGDKYQHFSQLIDVQVEEEKIYVKTRPMDWAKSNSVTPFYMENTYTVENDPNYGEYVKVVNKSTDFSGYVHETRRDQELPAFYGVTPLHKLVTYRGATPWTGGQLHENDNLDFWSPGTSENRFRASENWIAWVNDENWGVGLYVPDVTNMLVGRNEFSVNAGAIGLTPSEAVPCTYTAPLGVFNMPTYDPFTYTYYLRLGNVTLTRDLFSYLHAGGASNPDITRLMSAGN